MYHIREQIAKFSTHKMRAKPKSQKNVPANNCHPKVFSGFMHKSIYISAKFLVSKDQSSVEALNLPVLIQHRLVQMCWLIESV